MALSFGYTGITWQSDACEQAVQAISRNGFRFVEFFNFNLKDWEDRGGMAEMTAQYGVGLYSAYCSYQVVDPESRTSTLKQAEDDAKLIKKNGGTIMTLGGNGVDRKKTPFGDYKDYLVAIVTGIGRIARDCGIKACFHPHTGTPIETNDEIYGLMDAVDPEIVGFAPDVAQIQKGGTDPLEVLNRYVDRIEHVHLKDYGGKLERDPETGRELDSTGFLCYMPLGMGIMDLKGILALLERVGFSGKCMVELDGGFFGPDVREGRVTPPCTNNEAVEISRKWIMEAGFNLEV